MALRRGILVNIICLMRQTEAGKDRMRMAQTSLLFPMRGCVSNDRLVGASAAMPAGAAILAECAGDGDGALGRRRVAWRMSRRPGAIWPRNG